MPRWSPVFCRSVPGPTTVTACPVTPLPPPSVPLSRSLRPAAGAGEPSPPARTSNPLRPGRYCGRRKPPFSTSTACLPSKNSPTLAGLPDRWVTSLAALAHQVRLAWCGPEVEVEGILSAKTGGLSRGLPFLLPVVPVRHAGESNPLPRHRRSPSGGKRDQVGRCLRVLHRPGRPWSRRAHLGQDPRAGPDDPYQTGLNVAVSAGLLTEDQARRLAEGGVHRYNHNLETSRSFFPSVVTTHSWEERRETCLLVRDHGMELCCGALIGMGETDEQRIELLLQLQELDPTEVPLNFLNPRPGHPPGRGPTGGTLGGHPLDRPLSTRTPRRDPPLCRRAGDHPRRAAVAGHDLGHQRAHRRQLLDHAGPIS